MGHNRQIINIYFMGQTLSTGRSNTDKIHTLR